ncbi:putative transcription factor bHLH family [Dioscorea sansibarensis]
MLMMNKVCKKKGGRQNDFFFNDDSSRSVFAKKLNNMKEKDKIGERMVALKQLVSPFGKSDTASVLQDATEYIRFLHEQIQVLLSPYIGTRMINNVILHHQNHESSASSEEHLHGLCLMPIKSSLRMVTSNGADLWAPITATKHP